MAQQETLQENKASQKPNGKPGSDILIVPDTAPDRLADQIALYIGLPAIIYDGKAEPWILEPDEEMVDRMMIENAPFMRHIIAGDLAEKIIDKIDKNDKQPARVVFSDPFSSQRVPQIRGEERR